MIRVNSSRVMIPFLTASRTMAADQSPRSKFFLMVSKLIGVPPYSSLPASGSALRAINSRAAAVRSSVEGSVLGAFAASSNASMTASFSSAVSQPEKSAPCASYICTIWPSVPKKPPFTSPAEQTTVMDGSAATGYFSRWPSLK